MDGYRNIDTDVCRMQIKIGNIFIERILKKRRDIFLGLRQGILGKGLPVDFTDS